ncbi:NmrA-like family protein [Penicillium brevicompactum]|uniref:NmrA-like family protein n=1 Tax=Penicillium brevicompactum TaxID=5074 RepID=UPI002540F102|nr:NmrA-like family protein [Penicillium brevicompactum]KAJ5348523.1 NmrA-like family protein [Penicillium brevicompactum]
MTTVLITGATGKQGGSVIKKLLERNAPFNILAVTRDVNSNSAKKLAQKSDKITLIQGNLDNPAAIFDNVKRQSSASVWGVFSVQVRNSPDKDESIQ